MLFSFDMDLLSEGSMQGALALIFLNPTADLRQQ